MKTKLSILAVVTSAALITAFLPKTNRQKQMPALDIQTPEEEVFWNRKFIEYVNAGPYRSSPFRENITSGKDLQNQCAQQETIAGNTKNQDYNEASAIFNKWCQN